MDDDFMVADCLEEVLKEAGYDVCGIARTAAEALLLNERHHPALGVIDLRLANGECGTDVAAALRAAGDFAVLYATGTPDDPRLHLLEGDGCIAKPYTAAGVVAALRQVRERSAHLAAAASADASPTPHH